MVHVCHSTAVEIREQWESPSHHVNPCQAWQQVSLSSEHLTRIVVVVVVVVLCFETGFLYVTLAVLELCRSGWP